MGGGDGCTTTGICFMPLNCALQVVAVVNCRLRICNHNLINKQNGVHPCRRPLYRSQTRVLAVLMGDPPVTEAGQGCDAHRCR